MTCATCGGEIPNPRDPLVLFEVIGWERKRAQGGQNHVVDRRPTGRALCPHCASALLHGVNPRQERIGV